LIEELYGDNIDADLVQPGKVSPGMVYLNKCVFWHFTLLHILWRFSYMLKLSAFIY